MTARRVVWWLVVVALTVATLAAVSVGGWQLLIKSRRPAPVVVDQLTARQVTTEVASSGVTKLMSYSYETLDQDFSAATAMLTGEFRDYYQKFASEIIKPAAQQKQLKVTATVKRAGVVSLSGNAADILVFVDQTTTSKDQPAPTTATSSALVSLLKINGTWLINKFSPV